MVEHQTFRDPMLSITFWFCLLVLQVRNVITVSLLHALRSLQIERQGFTYKKLYKEIEAQSSLRSFNELSFINFIECTEHNPQG